MTERRAAEREKRGRVIAAVCKIQRDGDDYLVPSQAGKGRYHVRMEPYPVCTCPDYAENANKCKHVFAVEITIRREREVKVESDGA